MGKVRNRTPYNRVEAGREARLLSTDNNDREVQDILDMTPEPNDIDWEVVDSEVRALSYELLKRLYVGNSPFDNPQLSRFKDLEDCFEFKEIVNMAFYNAKIGEGLAI